MSPVQRSSVLGITIVVVVVACLFGAVENKSICGIGQRVRGDQLLVKDVLESRSAGVGRNQEIYFNYDIPEPITYIKIESIENIRAEVNFIYQEDLVKGYVAANNDSPSSSGVPFTVSILVYGFNATLLDSNPSYIINKNQQFKRHIQPEPIDEPADEEDDAEELLENQTPVNYENTAENPNPLDVSDYDYDDEEGVEDVAEDAEDEDGYELTDAIIEEGQRQTDDYLLYETDLISSSQLPGESTPSVVFYYIDSNFITYVKFSILDHYADKWSGGNSKAPEVEYSHLSENSLKAVIIDYHTPSMFAKMSIYGYKHDDVPIKYTSFLANITGHNVRVGAAGKTALATTDLNVDLLRSRLNMQFMTQAPDHSRGEDDVAADMNGAPSLNGNTNVQCVTSDVGGVTVSTVVYYVSISVTSLMLVFSQY